MRRSIAFGVCGRITLALSNFFIDLLFSYLKKILLCDTQGRWRPDGRASRVSLAKIARISNIEQPMGLLLGLRAQIIPTTYRCQLQHFYLLPHLKHLKNKTLTLSISPSFLTPDSSRALFALNAPSKSIIFFSSLSPSAASLTVLSF
jgi:hypothetical protein